MLEHDIVSVIRQEARHAAVRARNGLQYVASLNPPPVGDTDKEVVWREDQAQLWRYRFGTPRYQPPIVVFLGLVSRSYVLDLLPDTSFVRHLGRAGFDVFLLDWGVPTDADADNTLETYVDFYLPRALEAAARESGSEELTLLPYCMGGMFALLLAATHPEIPLRAMALLAPPVDFDLMGPLVEPLRSGALDPETLIDEKGFVPGETIRAFFNVRRPTSDAVAYANLVEKLSNDAFVESHRAMAQWMRDQIPLPGAAFRQITDMFLKQNGFMLDTVRLDGRRASLSDIGVPILSVTAELDDIVPLAASKPLGDLVAGEVTETVVPAGHVALVMGRRAERTTIPAIVDWLARHSDEPARTAA
jgi:polyhydroxyalkanoate synthase